MMQMADPFLVKCLKPTINLETFDVLHLAVFIGNAFKIDFKRTPFTSVNTRKHKENIFNNSYGYKSRLEIRPENIMLRVVSDYSIPVFSPNKPIIL